MSDELKEVLAALITAIESPARGSARIDAINKAKTLIEADVIESQDEES